MTRGLTLGSTSRCPDRLRTGIVGTLGGAVRSFTGRTGTRQPALTMRAQDQSTFGGSWCQGRKLLPRTPARMGSRMRRQSLGSTVLPILSGLPFLSHFLHRALTGRPSPLRYPGTTRVRAKAVIRSLDRPRYLQLCHAAKHKEKQRCPSACGRQHTPLSQREQIPNRSSAMMRRSQIGSGYIKANGRVLPMLRIRLL